MLTYPTLSRIERFRSLFGLLLVLASFAIAPVAGAQQPPESLPFDNPNPDSLTISEALDLVLAAGMSKWDAQYVARKAGYSRDPSYIPQLKQIAALYAPTYTSVAVNALHALWELGEPRDYFMGLAEDWAQSRELAYYAIYTLARDPNPSELATLKTIEQEARAADVNIRSAISEYELVLDLIAFNKEEPWLLYKVDLLFGYIARGLTSIISVEDSLEFVRGSANGEFSPGVVWSRDALRGMAQQHPDSVQHFMSLFRTALEEKYGPERGPIIARDFGEYVEEEAFREGPVWLPTPTLPNLPGAITIASENLAASFSGGSFTISGFDHTADGQPSGSGDDTHGLLATTVATQQNVLDALSGNQQNNVIGTGLAPDVVQSTLDFDPAQLIDALLPLVTDTLTVSHTGTLGSAEAPIVAYAPDGLTLSGNLTGTGVLLVDGTLVEQGSVEWTGLIIVRSSGATPPGFEMRGNVGITGSVLLYNDAASAASLIITGTAEVRSSRAIIEMLRTALGLQ